MAYKNLDLENISKEDLIKSFKFVRKNHKKTLKQANNNLSKMKYWKAETAEWKQKYKEFSKEYTNLKSENSILEGKYNTMRRDRAEKTEKIKKMQKEFKNLDASLEESQDLNCTIVEEYDALLHILNDVFEMSFWEKIKFIFTDSGINNIILKHKNPTKND